MEKYYPKAKESNDDSKAEELTTEKPEKNAAQLLQEEIQGLKKDAKRGKTGRFTALDTVCQIKLKPPGNIYFFN